MNIEFFKNLELTVARGENSFKMSRGSFRYRQKISGKIRLQRCGEEAAEGGFRLVFKEPASRRRHFVDVTQQDGRIKVAYAGTDGEGGRDLPGRFWLSFPADPKEHVYGCGETYSKLDLKGERVRIFVAEHQNTKRIGTKMIREKITGKKTEKAQKFLSYESYYAQPTYVSSGLFYMHADLRAYAEFDFTRPERTVIFTQEAPVLYFESAESFPQLSEKLAGLLGRQRELPDLIFDGAILAVQGGTDVIDQKLAAAEAAGAAVCGVWSQDWCGCRKTGFGYQVMWNWEWDRDLYPDLDKKIPEWKAKGVRFLGYINPFIALEKDLYKTASAKGYCVKNKKGEDYLVTITTFPAAMVDFTNPEAYAWYKGLIKENMIGLGLGGWMADFGEYLPMDCVLFSGEDPEKIHNRWPAIWARMNREAIEECGVQDEVFFFTRAGNTGSVQDSAMMWTGDQHVDWSPDDGLPSVIPATLSLAMSGYGVTHSDVGGYTTVMHMTRPKELLLRWEEMNVFSPLMRFHEGNQPSRNVQFDADEELLTQLSRMSRMHKGLKPYLKELVKENAELARPVMRPLFYHYNEELAYKCTDEYLLGRDLLIAPVIKDAARERTVYLPEDEWVQLFTGAEYGGGIISVQAPIGRPPVFVRKASPRFDELMELGKI